MDKAFNRVFKKRVPNHLELILQTLDPFRDQIKFEDTGYVRAEITEIKHVLHERYLLVVYFELHSSQGSVILSKYRIFELPQPQR